MVKKISVGLLCLSLLMSCMDSPIAYKYVSVDAKGWEKTDSVRIQIPPQERTTEATILFSVRTTRSYPYNDLHIRATIQRNEKRISTKDCKIKIYDEKGLFAGKGVLYADNITSTPIHIKLDKDSIYTICITHLMESTNLEGISDVGIKVDKPAK